MSCYNDPDGERCWNDPEYEVRVDYTVALMLLCNGCLVEWRSLWPDSIVSMRSIRKSATLLLDAPFALLESDV